MLGNSFRGLSLIMQTPRAGIDTNTIWHTVQVELHD